jgi:hypothetical protein
LLLSPFRRKAAAVLDAVNKPEGYELRTHRAEKQETCEAWEPRDALYEAQQLMEGKQVSSCVVIWREVDGKGNSEIRARRAGPADETARITMQKAGYYMGWSA